ncbi:MAG TPA: hypothetical protein VLT33_26760 [Labilithrix sp.]|nr:hypothetical protein [Labilithrix sp.]
MGGPAPVELSADCTTCGLEGGLVELYDPLVAACRFGVPASARCKLCGVHHQAVFAPPPTTPLRDIPANRCPACRGELGPRALDDRRCAKCGATATLSLVAPAASLASEAALVAALDAWAAREQWASRDALAEATFCDPDLASLLLRIQRGEPLEVIADPFANMGIRTTGRDAADKPRAAPVVSVGPLAEPPLASRPVRIAMPEPAGAAGWLPAAPVAVPIRFLPTPPAGTRVPVEMLAPASRPPPPPPPSAPPRAIVYPLVSVIAADGEIHPAERALIDRFLESEGLTPLTEDEFKVHHPSAVAHLVPPERRDTVVQLMCETATVDGMPDESERRVIRAYAAAWNVPDEKVEFWMWGYENMSTGIVRQLWMKLRRFVLSARWSDAGQETR